MKSVSSEFKEIWARKYGRKEILRIRYKRRYWNGSAYVYEADWTDLGADEFAPMRSIHWKLDVPNLNEVLSSTVTLRLKDADRRWLPASGSPSIFAADNVAASGYEPYRMKFQVQYGYILDDGTKEYVALFTGMAEDFRFDSMSGDVDVTVSSNDRLLRDADATQVSDAFTLEDCSPATGDGSNLVFYTTSTGVGAITAVVQNGVTKTQGTDYSISQTNEAGVAKITMVVAPTAGHTMKSTGYKWKAGQTIETLIGLLCDEAGVTDRTINAALFPGGLSGSQTIDSQAQFQAGTLTNVDAVSVPGSIVGPWTLFDNFSDDKVTGRDAPGAPEWTQIDQNGVGSVEADVQTIQANASFEGVAENRAVRKAPSTQTTGSWRTKSRTVNSIASATAGDGAFWLFQSNGSTSSLSLTGYGLRWNTFNGKIELVKWNAEGSIAGTVLADVQTGFDPGADNYWTITRTAAGAMIVSKNGTQMASVTDNTIVACTETIIGARMQGAGTIVQSFDDIFNSTQTSAWSGTWESAEIDLSSAPTGWGVLERTETLSGGTLTYSTRTATASGGAYDAAVAIAADGTIQSALKRYLKIVVTFDSFDDHATPQPQVDKLIARFTVTTVNLTIANFTAKTCYAAIQRLAQICDYEWGFNGEGSFFFRSKTVSGAAALDLTQENAIADLRDYRLGYDQVITVGRVRYGLDSSETYVNEYDAAAASEASPTSEERFGRRIREENFSDVLLANDVNLGAARARLIRDNQYLPRDRFRLECRMIPHADLSDIASATFMPRPRDRNPMMDDHLQTFGDSAFGPATNVLALDKRVKIVGITYTFEPSHRCSLEVQGVLS